MTIETNPTTNKSARRMVKRDRTLAKVNSLLASVIPYDDWVLRRNPSEDDKAMYHNIVAGLERERKSLIDLGAKVAKP